MNTVNLFVGSDCYLVQIEEYEKVVRWEKELPDAW